MAENNIIFALVGLFVAVAIMIGISTMILGSTVTDCEGLPGYDVNGSSDWALACEENNGQIQNAFSLLTIILVVVAAITILVIIRFLG